MASPAADQRWALFQADIADAVANLSDGAALYTEGLGAGDARQRRIREKAFQKFLQDGYSSIERMLIRLLELYGVTPPAGRSWHADLLFLTVDRGANPMDGMATRPPFAPGLLPQFRVLMQFRHFAMHGYGGFEAAMAAPAADAAARIAAALPAAAEEFGRAAGLLPPAA